MQPFQTLISTFPDLSLGDLEGYLNQGLFLAEGVNGANRPLAIQKYVEVKKLSQNSIPFTNTPVLENSVEHPIKVYLGSATQDWLEIDPDEYNIDYDLGTIFLNATAIRDPYRSQTLGVYRSRPYNQCRRKSIKVSYYSGFDFDAYPLSYGADEILKALIALVGYVQKPQYQDGTKRFKLDRHYEVEYLTSSETNPASSEIMNLLQVFQKYRARDYSI
jgi:hypothetical protein